MLISTCYILLSATVVFKNDDDVDQRLQWRHFCYTTQSRKVMLCHFAPQDGVMSCGSAHCPQLSTESSFATRPFKDCCDMLHWHICLCRALEFLKLPEYLTVHLKIPISTVVRFPDLCTFGSIPILDKWRGLRHLMIHWKFKTPRSKSFLENVFCSWNLSHGDWNLLTILSFLMLYLV